MAASYAGFAGAAIRRTGNKEGTAKGGSKSHAARRGRLSLAFPGKQAACTAEHRRPEPRPDGGEEPRVFIWCARHMKKEHKYFLSTICIVESGKAR
jgi:hypothetical protein